MITFQDATQQQRERFLDMVLSQLGSDSVSAFDHLGITEQDFVRLYDVTGHVRAVREDTTLAGFVWIEHRERTLHVHGIVLFPECRGHGIGAQVIDHLAREFADRADFIELGVQTSNSGALRSYKRRGFEPMDRQLPSGFAVLRKSISCAVS